MIERRRFTRLDVHRALCGVISAGLVPEEVIITPSGEIRVRTQRAEEYSSREVTDELERHFGKSRP